MRFYRIGKKKDGGKERRAWKKVVELESQQQKTDVRAWLWLTKEHVVAE